MYADQDDEMGGIEQFRKKREVEEPDFEALSPKEPEPMGVLPVAPAVKAPASDVMDLSQYMTSPEEMQAVAEKKAKNAKISGLFDALANRERAGSFGAAFLGNTPQRSDSSKQVEADNALADAPIVAKQQALKNAMAKQALHKSAMANKKELEAEAEDKNPNSPRSILIRNFLNSKGQKIDQNASYADLSKAYPPAVLKLIEAKSKENTKDPLIELIRRQQFDKNKEDVSAREFKKTPQGKIESLPVEGKQKLSFAESILTNLDKLEESLDKGEKPSYTSAGSWLDSNSADESVALAAESYGRLQSGGAINKDEDARFRKILPNARDFENKDTARRKIQEARAEMKIRLGQYGLKPEDLPTYGQKFKNGNKSEDQQAIDWLKNNPNDPDAEGVKAKLISKGVKI